MAVISYHASHEQFSPRHLLSLVCMAERAGFDAIHASDHFHPWSKRQGQSGFTLSWIGAAMQATLLPFSMVCTPGQRLHPAIVAQAVATLAEMFPGRFTLELGSGEALNESITGDPWPSKQHRNERLKESYHIIKQLLKGEEVTFRGHIHVDHAKLYTLPQLPPLLLCAAISEQTTAWVATFADGLLTTAGEVNDIRKKMQVFRNNGGEGKPVYIQFAFSYAGTEKEALEGAYDQWRSNLLSTDRLANLSRVEQFDNAAKSVTIEDVKNSIPVYTDMTALREQLHTYAQLGVDEIILHNVNRMQELFIEDYKMSHRP